MWMPPKDKIFMVADIGLNANGDVLIAKQLITACKNAGFDCVKFQKRTIDICYTEDELNTPRESPWGDTTGEQKRGLEFGLAEYKQIDAHCREIGIPWTASPWDTPSVDFLLQFDIPYIKIASASVTDKELLKRCMMSGKPIWISTGMCSFSKILDIVDWMEAQNHSPQMVYHCTSTYPSKITELNLNTIQSLINATRLPIGFSGHEPGIATSVMAAACGAKSIERHVTLRRSMYGSDQAASLEPPGFRRLVRDVRDWEKARGDGLGYFYESEKPIAKKLRRVDDFEDDV